MSLIAALKLPLDERGQRRAAARAEWFAAQDKPLELARHARGLSSDAGRHAPQGPSAANS